MALARALGAALGRGERRTLELIRGAVDDHGGVVVRTEGDAVFAVFPEARPAVAAAVAAQQALDDHDWPDGATVRVRMGLHTGEAHLAGDDYGGFEVNRAARVAAVGHGGQIVLSGPTAGADRRRPAAPALGSASSGRFVLKDVPRPERLFQLDVAGSGDGVPAGPRRAGRRRQPRPAADELHRARRGSSTTLRALADAPARHAHRARRHRQVEPGRGGRARSLADDSAMAPGSCRLPTSRRRRRSAG